MASSQVFLSDLKSGCFVSGRRGMLGAELMSVDMLLLDSKIHAAVSLVGVDAAVADIAGVTAASSSYGKDEQMAKTVVADPRSVNAVLRGVAKWKVRYIKEVWNIASVTPVGKGLTTSE
ncbi:hypothetical protein Bca4012_089720 [Brassica carinata]|uniref:VAN3-binding protein-like auxin canalisation domain-containing protein n=1 Tax=Brassica oleracea TaxID=3712 RepID=A0A3P6F195_BRAOL|nr:unnamed protein product [Brassica oleracea]